MLAFVALVALGLPDALPGAVRPSIRAAFSLPLDAIGMLLTATLAMGVNGLGLGGLVGALPGAGRLIWNPYTVVSVNHLL